MKLLRSGFSTLREIDHLRYIKNFLENCISGYSVHPARDKAGISYDYHYYLLENYEEYRRAHDLFKKANKGFYTGPKQKSRVVKRKI